jgi:rhodanese-related sulfurtransferase
MEADLNRCRVAPALALTAAAFAPPAVHAGADKATADALEGSFDVVDAHAGTVLSGQSSAEKPRRFHVLDVRDAGRLAKEHLPGAVGIEWRQVFAQLARLPKDKTLLVHGSTSSFAAQAATAPRMDGVENVQLPCGGCNERKARGGPDAHARASSRR